MTQELWVPGPLPGLNEIVAAAKGFGGRGYGYAKLKREWTDVVALLARRLQPMTAAHLRFTWVEPRRQRNPDNIAAGKKFVIDGLVKAGVLPEDGWRQVLSFSDSWEVGSPGVRVILSAA